MLTAKDAFTAFAEEAGPRLRGALCARFGPDRGAEASAEALAYGWEHWEQIREMENPIGYLYRVGQRRGYGRRQRRPVFPQPPEHRDPIVEPALPGALARLSAKQRTAVVLVHCFDWTHEEVADLLGVSPSTISTHVQRGMAKLRKAIGGAS